ncbi:hypothetical protein INP77_09695 [Methylophilus sp. 13]|uniref:hypothetical protein n=1 Tax=Methylophilus sp. 13 TaxID=2781018 RepID=UPI00188FC8B7|nr:hypothetical protein [Methylophilus sp. 13]MBF5039760.1 hypothetical protein [Methylophilus sp. 13]
MNIEDDSIEKLRALKDQLSREINQNFNDTRFNLIVAVSDAALNLLFEEMQSALRPIPHGRDSL